MQQTHPCGCTDRPGRRGGDATELRQVPSGWHVAPVYGLGHSFRFAVRINHMPSGSIIALGRETHLCRIAE